MGLMAEPMMAVGAVMMAPSAGLVICATVLVVLEIRRVELANYLPVLVVAPLLAKLLA